MTARLLPDVLTLVIDYLIARTDVQTTFGAAPVRLGSKIDPTAEATLPAARLTIVSTLPIVRRHFDGTSIQFEIWADDELAAFDGANLLRGAIHDDDPAETIVGTRDAGGGRTGIITGVEDSLGIRPLEDPDAPELYRTIFGVRVYAHP